MTVRLLSACSLITTILTLFEAEAQSLNTWQRYDLLQQAKKEQALLSGQLGGASSSQAVYCADTPNQPGLRRAPMDCRSGDFRSPSGNPSRAAIIREARTSNVPSSGSSAPGSTVTRPGAPSITGSPSFNPPSPRPTTIANITPQTVPTNGGLRLQGTATSQQFLFAPAPSTPSRPNVASAPTIGRPSGTIQNILGNLRRR
jgi:hypothetical protein